MESLIVEFDQFSRAVAKFLYLDGRYKSKKSYILSLTKKKYKKSVEKLVKMIIHLWQTLLTKGTL